ncbi:hypothetical protein GH714_041007 [Hevea brasiliensis]|uniref:Retrotransposon gag domain-containing protein n=1 Tax=Hevea brasiliensis TaxID=3981 RepID=A0A6A6N7U3_HEVBR|nr:hypothetical protein GH714_041007 [Hevea brasiliensis]
MEGRMERVERKVGTIEEATAAMHLDQKQRFSRLENMIAAMDKTKTTIEVEEASNPLLETTPQRDTSIAKPTARTFLFEDAGTVAKKVDVPSFDGNDPVGWLARTEQYFEIHGVQNELKVSLALVSMEFAKMEDISGMSTTTELDEAHFSRLELPLYSVGGIQQPRTMKFQAKIVGHPVVVMVDSGDSHNFISTQLVQQLNLPIFPTPSFNVKLGDGCYHFLVEYKSGSSNKVVDALSRKDEEMELQVQYIPHWADWDEIAKEVAADVLLGGIIADLKSGTKLYSNFCIIHDKLYFKDRAIRDHPVISDLPVNIKEGKGPMVEPETIFHRRQINRNHQIVSQVSVCWKGQSMDKATWADEFDISSQFPHFNLEDKANSQQGGNDRDANVAGPVAIVSTGSRSFKVYSRRKRAEKDKESATQVLMIV